MENQNNIKVSIVMPVYNTAPYLRQCLDSVLAQTLEEFELICVDDGSTDGSLEILEEYAKKDNRIQIIKQKNQHAGIARNNGLKVAKGEYVIFLDSDDVFADVLLEHTYSAGVEKDADIVLIDILGFDHSTKKPQWTILAHKLLPDKPTFSWCDIPEDIFSVAPPNTFSGIYRRKFINEHNLQFQALPNSNDVYFTLYARVLAKKIAVVDETLVYYRTGRAGSLQSNQKDTEPLCFLQAFYALYCDLVKDGLYVPLKSGFQNRFLDTLLYNLESAKFTKTRLAILRALDEEPYCNLPIDDEITGDEKNRDVMHYKRVKAAREWYHKNLRIEQLNEELKNAKTAPPIEEQGTVTVSVIIPVYNTEKYLREAMDSIVNQTLRDIEIICVNDGSTDGSAEILEEYAKKDNRISIITQENKGLSCARNAGIMAAKGKYIYFMDSDDILETTALEELIPIMKGKNLDVMCFDGESFTENPELMTPYYQTNFSHYRSYDDVYEGTELLKLFELENKYNCVVWLYVFRTSFLRENDLYFIPGILHEDNAFTFSVLLKTGRISHLNKIYYHYRLHNDSIVNKQCEFINVYSYYLSYLDMFKTYFAYLPAMSKNHASYVLQIICNQLSNTQAKYATLPYNEAGSELGMTDDLYTFKMIIANGTNEAQLKKQLNNTREDLKKQRARSDRLYNTSEKNRKRKEELNEKFKKSWQQNEELKDKLGTARQSNSELKKELKKRKKENEALKKKLKAARAENKKIKNSRAYKLGRIIMYIPHRIKRLFKK